MPNLDDFPEVACGYRIPQDYMTELYWDPSRPFNSAVLANKMLCWDLTIPPEERQAMPSIRLLFRDVNSENYDDIDFFLTTRVVRLTNLKLVEDVQNESSKDKEKKMKFVKAFGRNIDEGKLKYDVVDVKSDETIR